jgi:hypothetical protein
MEQSSDVQALTLSITKTQSVDKLFYWLSDHIKAFRIRIVLNADPDPDFALTMEEQFLHFFFNFF